MKLINNFKKDILIKRLLYILIVNGFGLGCFVKNLSLTKPASQHLLVSIRYYTPQLTAAGHI